MSTKKGAGGRQQNYDSHGRYAKTTFFYYGPPQPQLSRKEKAILREEHRREDLFNRARKSKDKYLFDVFMAIEDEMPGEVIAVNDIRFDPNIGGNREFDIITKRCIIEVKSQQVRHKLTQLLQQKTFAQSKNKLHIVFAPDILPGCKYDYERNGIKIAKSVDELIKLMKEESL